MYREYCSGERRGGGGRRIAGAEACAEFIDGTPPRARASSSRLARRAVRRRSARESGPRTGRQPSSPRSVSRALWQASQFAHDTRASLTATALLYHAERSHWIATDSDYSACANWFTSNMWHLCSEYFLIISQKLNTKLPTYSYLWPHRLWSSC